MQTGVTVRGETIKAAQCERCGVKLYPATQLEPHMADHKKRDAYFEKSKKWLSPRLKRLGKNLG